MTVVLRPRSRCETPGGRDVSAGGGRGTPTHAWHRHAPAARGTRTPPAAGCDPGDRGGRLRPPDVLPFRRRSRRRPPRRPPPPRRRPARRGGARPPRAVPRACPPARVFGG